LDSLPYHHRPAAFLYWSLSAIDIIVNMHESELFSAERMRVEKRTVARNSVYASVGITLFKVVVGITTGSLGILSEAAHSGLDMIAAIITLLSVRVSDKPADADHQYGHGKFENFSAFIETGLLLLTCVWIIYEAIRRLFFHSGPEVEPSIAAFVVMFFSIAVDWWRSRKLKKIAVRYDSQALTADALHFSTDIWSSGVVILGLALVEVARRFHIAWLRAADPISALCVAGVVVYVSWRLARQTIDALLDAAPAEVRAQIQGVVTAVNGVLEVDRIRTRRAGAHYFVDVSIGLARTVTFQRAEQVAADVTRAVNTVLPEADVMVNTIARAARSENLFDRVRAVATRNNLNVHDISVQDFGRGQLHLEQHLELDENLTLIDAHSRVTQLEAEIRQDIPEIATILTHIESEPATIEPVDNVNGHPSLERRLKKIANEFSPDVIDVHDVRVRRVRDRVYVSCHCTMQDNLPLSRVHDLSTALEIRFKQVSPKLFRVLIHTEPQTDNARGFDVSDLQNTNQSEHK
jgi:cation diffusion facilitator family transporter